MKSLGLMLATMALSMLVVPAWPEDAASAPYEDYIQDIPAKSTKNKGSAPATWSSGDANSPSQHYQQPDAQPLPGLDQTTPKVPAEAIRKRTKEVIDETTFLRSTDEPEEEPKPLDRKQIVAFVLIGLGFGLVGGLIGAGIELIRTRRDNKPGRRRHARIPRSPRTH